MKQTKLKFEKIHEDVRGEIYLLTGLFPEEKEVTIFITKKGFARGGCIHRKNAEYCCILDGTIDYYIEGNPLNNYLVSINGSNVPIQRLHKGDTVLIKKAKQHYFVAITDSLVLEWGATPEEKKEKGEWKKHVNEINKRNKK